MGDTNGKSVFDKPKRKDQTTGEAFKSFIWNTETSEFCGRTGLSWFKITGFYIIFFSCLALFFMSMLSLFFMTISDDEPRWQLDESLIGSNPGVGFRPMPDQDKNAESTLIWIGEKQDSFWYTELNNYFEKNYKKKPSTNHTCTFENGEKADATTACEVNLESLDASGFGCSNATDKYGYFGKNTQPCVLIKLNKIYGWKPEPITTEQDLKLAVERGMPEDLKEKISALSKKTDDVSKRQLETTWISCAGENPADRENIGPIQYWAPGFSQQFQGIPNFYFPYKMQEGYKSPFIFVKFLRPQKNLLIQVECKAWAKNIVADRFFRLGSVHFEIMMDI